MIEHAGTCSIDTLSANELRFSHGSGGIVYSENGEKYYDFILGFGPVVLGHSDPEFNRDVATFLTNGIHFPSYSLFHEELSEIIEKHGWRAVSFFKTSSESVTAAIRIAMHATRRKELIRCGFLGWHDAEIAFTGSWHEPPDSELRKQLRFTENFRGVTGNERVWNWVDFKLDELEDLLRKQNIAAFIIDAYQLYFTNTIIIEKAFDLCKTYGVITILDETKTSGRITFMGIGEELGLKPDLLVLGKAVANGAPLSILCGKNELSEYARAARITGTFSKEALSVYCALSTKKIMDERNGYKHLKQTGNRIVDLFNDAAVETRTIDHAYFKPVFGGGMFNLEFSPEIDKNMVLRKQLRLLLASNGILLLQGHPSFICLSHDSIDENDFKERAKKAFHEWHNKIS